MFYDCGTIRLHKLILLLEEMSAGSEYFSSVYTKVNLFISRAKLED